MSVKKYHFGSGREMLDVLLSGVDLYSPQVGMYVFLYNGQGAIAFYDLDEEEVKQLAHDAAEVKEYWGAFLGPGGWICDDPNDKDNPPFPGNSNIDFCNDWYGLEWIDTDDMLEYLAQIEMTETE